MVKELAQFRNAAVVRVRIHAGVPLRVPSQLAHLPELLAVIGGAAAAPSCLRLAVGASSWLDEDTSPTLRPVRQRPEQPETGRGRWA